MTNGVKIDEGTFEDLDHSKQNTILFKNTEILLKTMTDFQTQFSEEVEACDEKVDTLERKVDRRKWLDKGVSFVGGIVGGVLAVISGIGK